jgi:hypothetical protein
MPKELIEQGVRSRSGWFESLAIFSNVVLCNVELLVPLTIATGVVESSVACWYTLEPDDVDVIGG